jgi:hypothetical protein
MSITLSNAYSCAFLFCFAFILLFLFLAIVLKVENIQQKVLFLSKPNLPSHSHPLKMALQGSQPLPDIKMSHLMPNKGGEFVQSSKWTK